MAHVADDVVHALKQRGIDARSLSPAELRRVCQANATAIWKELSRRDTPLADLFAAVVENCSVTILYGDK